jgi:hypothetical protein
MTIKSSMDIPFLEAASFWSNIAVVVFGVLAAVAGGCAWYFSSRLDALKDSDFARFRLESTEKIADAQKKQEKAEAALRKLEDSAAEDVRAKEAFAALQRTPPKIKAYLASSERTGDLLVVMDAENLVPFRARWRIVTKKDKIVSGIMLEGHEIYPTDKQKRFNTKANINAAEVTDEYVELRFRYESIYSAELGNPSELRGEIVQRYRFKDNRIFPWE